MDPEAKTPSPAFAARLMEAEELPVWWRAPLGASRSAAEALGRSPVESARWDESWGGFAAPFLAAAQHVEAIRNPAPMMTALGRAARDEAAEKPGETRLPGAIGSARSDADTARGAARESLRGSKRTDKATHRRGSEFGPKPPATAKAQGSWVETGNPTSGRGARDLKPASMPPHAPSYAGSRAPKSRQIGAPPGAASETLRGVNSIEADLGLWLTRAQKAMHDFAAAQGFAAKAGAKASLAQDDSAQAQAWLKAWLREFGESPSASGMGDRDSAAERGPASSSGSAGAFGRTNSSGPSGFASHASAANPAFASASPFASAGSASAATRNSARPGIPGKASAPKTDWAALLEELMPTGEQAPRPASPQPTAPVASGARSLLERIGVPSEVTSKLRPSQETSHAGDAMDAIPSRLQGQSPVEWLEEEEDLAGKLHRLLRRQAKRRGVDLS